MMIRHGNGAILFLASGIPNVDFGSFLLSGRGP